MRRTTNYPLGQRSQFWAAWLLLCAFVFSFAAPFGSASASAGVPATATKPAQCRMASTPKPCCCPGGHTEAASAKHRALAASVSRPCTCDVRPAPIAPVDNTPPARFVDAFSPLGVTPPLLPLASVLPHFAATLSFPRPAFLLGPPLRSPPHAPDTGRAPPASLSV